jgi:hypothetical protein
VSHWNDETHNIYTKIAKLNKIATKYEKHLLYSVLRILITYSYLLHSENQLYFSKVIFVLLLFCKWRLTRINKLKFTNNSTQCLLNVYFASQILFLEYCMCFSQNVSTVHWQINDFLKRNSSTTHLLCNIRYTFTSNFFLEMIANLICLCLTHCKQ